MQIQTQNPLPDNLLHCPLRQFPENILNRIPLTRKRILHLLLLINKNMLPVISGQCSFRYHQPPAPQNINRFILRKNNINLYHNHHHPTYQK